MSTFDWQETAEGKELFSKAREMGLNPSKYYRREYLHSLVYGDKTPQPIPDSDESFIAEELEAIEEIETKEDTISQAIKAQPSYKELVAKAKKLGLKTFAVKKEDLIDQINEMEMKV